MRFEIELSREVDLMKIARELEKKFNIKLTGDEVHGYLCQLWIGKEGKIIVELFEEDKEPDEFRSYRMLKHPLSADEIDKLKQELNKLIKSEEQNFKHEGYFAL